MTQYLSFIIALCLCVLALQPANSFADTQESRATAKKHLKDDNYKEALAIYTTLLTETNDAQSFSDLEDAIRCLSHLNRISEADSLLEKSIDKHAANVAFLITSGSIYAYGIPHNGNIIAGEFQRGNHRGGGQYADASERDRIRALQLHLKALQQDKITNEEKSSAYHQIDRAISMKRQHRSAYKLQKLTDLTTLPDYEIGNRWGRGGRDPQGAPVDADGAPLFYQIPASWADAKNDGERWRFAIQQSSSEESAQQRWADFLHSQFGVTTMASYGWFRNISSHSSNNSGDEQKGILQLHTLKDNETVAKLASGVKRFPLPDDQNFIAIYKKLSSKNEHSADRLIQIYLDRRQHKKAVTLLESTIEQFPKNKSSLKQRKKLRHQITGNWGKFEGQSGS